MPMGLSMPPAGTPLGITPVGGTTRATTASFTDHTITIENFVSDTEVKAPFTYSFGISGVTNQMSVKDAGSYSIETYYKASNGNYYLVDI